VATGVGAVRHARAAALAALAPLLAVIRRDPRLKERGTGVFYARGKAFLHFHEDPAGLFADVKQAEDWLRLPVNSAAERATLLQTLAEVFEH
jgi:hypothetical protein